MFRFGDHITETAKMDSPAELAISLPDRREDCLYCGSEIEYGRYGGGICSNENCLAVYDDDGKVKVETWL